MGYGYVINGILNYNGWLSLAIYAISQYIPGHADYIEIQHHST